MQENSKIYGFTLIEVAVVLLIVSFIVVALVQGSALMRSAEMTEISSKFAHYKSAFDTFKIKYNAVAGDFRQAQQYWPGCADDGSNECNGNKNGRIEAALDEDVRAWQHLSLAGVIQGTFNGEAVTPPVLNLTVPEAITDSNIFTLSHRTLYGVDANMLSFLEISNGSDTIDAEEAITVDRKLDDGTASRGNVLVWQGDSGECVDAAPTSAEADFMLSDSRKNCRLSFIMD